MTVVILPPLAFDLESREGETIFVRECEYGREVEMRLDVRRHGRRYTAIMPIRMGEARPEVVFAHALDSLRRHIATQAPDLVYLVPQTSVNEAGLQVPSVRPSVSVPPDTIQVLVEFAKAGKEDEFRWLARSAGVQGEQLEELWRGTVSRCVR